MHFGRKILRVRVGIDEFSVCVHAKSRVLQIEPGRSCEEQMNRRRTREEEAREEEKDRMYWANGEIIDQKNHWPVS